MDSGKCLHRLHRVTFSLYALTIFAPALVSAQELDSSAQTIPSVQILDQFVAAVSTLTARFEQELWTSDQERIETASGRFSLQRPNRFVWHYEQPYEQLVVADGEWLWMYDVELEQITKSPLDAANPAMLLSGEQGVADSFDVTAGSPDPEREWIKLVPKRSGGDFSLVMVGFDGDIPRELEFVDGLNNTTRIEFSDVDVNPELDPALFRFDPPAGVHVIGPQ